MPAIILPGKWRQQPQYEQRVKLPGKYAVLLPSLRGAKMLSSGPDGLTYENANNPYADTLEGNITLGFRPNSSTESGECFRWSSTYRPTEKNATMFALLGCKSFGPYVTRLTYGPTLWGLELSLSTSGLSGRYVDSPTTAGYTASISFSPQNNRLYAVALRLEGNTVSAFYNGQKASTTGGNGGIRADAYGLGAGQHDNFQLGNIALGALTSVALSDAEIFKILGNLWGGIFDASPRILYFPSAGGGGTTGTGAPAAQSATVAGTATRTVTGSGTPTAQAATAAGAAEREITSSGTPAAQSATVSGTGTVGAVVTGSGSPQAQSATVAGTAERTVTASGAVAAQSATVAGTAEREITSSGTPTAQSATVVGTGQVGNIISGSGTPTAQSATVSGTAEREITASGTVSASSATVVGTAERTVTGTGTLSASSATVYGFDSAPVSGNPTSGGGTGKVYSSKKLRKEVDEWLEKQQEAERQKILARIQREDEELLVIMLALAA